MVLPNNQSLSLKPGKALSIMAEAHLGGGSVLKS